MTDLAVIDTPAERPNKRKTASAATRAKIIRAACEVFTRRDYGRATIRAIAAGAGMSTGAIFANFPDKEALWRAAMGTEPPVDTPVVRAAPNMLAALKALMAFRPLTPVRVAEADQIAAAWAAAEQAVALAEGRAESTEARAA